MKKKLIFAWLMTGALALASCSVIDDDRSDCPPEDQSYELDYELRLVTNLTTELQTSLTAETSVNVANALREHLKNIFTDFAHDVDLSFYDTQGDSLRLHHDRHVMDANQASYTLYLPMRQYMHLAVANVADNHHVSIDTDLRCHSSRLLQTTADTIGSHTTGLFTARLPMEVLGNTDQHFDVHLYMANCAAALVLDTVGGGATDIRIFTTGFATGFNIADSVYRFALKDPVVRNDIIDTPSSPGTMTFCSVSFPSREMPATRTVIETTDPFVAPEAAESLWQFMALVRAADGTTTKTDLYLKTPLRAGQLRVLKARLHTDGSVRTTDPTVGVSVTTNWSPGGHFNPEL